ncbi:hypothetical protein PSCICO_50550 [Pseudomonas cichorii]|uniref:Uncharacterized protein n=1 Tax=Pseudomonas serbiensis TaxID=3064350 RepID=A0ABT9CT20_9PSED|nr:MULTISPECIES: hypothetical protein [Pseudomonas]MDO7928649.1 hypothetical protein [Pseudomonas sp. KFB-138]GFM81550.1 hypothetical protein PSCICN_22420 [Pseudomonas cichorii]GFM89656.1 hypothetical protein PSCICO_50550 [Pseudomonas cichorii]
MATVEFYFQTQNAWNMGPACGTTITNSSNPAPATTACIYIIHNTHENSTYVGYADNAFDRWKSRTEVFHIMGIPNAYAKNILCAYCLPTVSGGHSMYLKGANNCEHLLVRAVANGLLGKTTNTNSQLATLPFSNSTATKVQVYLPSDPWGKLEGRKQDNVGLFY